MDRQYSFLAFLATLSTLIIVIRLIIDQAFGGKKVDAQNAFDEEDDNTSSGGSAPLDDGLDALG